MDWKIRNVCAVLCCLSSPLILANDSSGYFWDFGDGTVSYLAEPEHQYEAAGIYTVKREVYQNGVLVDKSEKVVDLVSPKIVELDITLPQSITEKEQTQLTAKFITSEPLEAIRYQWYVDEQSLGDALSDPVITHVFSDAGTYVLTLNVLWEQTTVRSLEVDVVVEEQNDNTDPDNGGKDPGDGDTDPGDGDTDPGDGDTDPGDGDTDPGDGDTDPGDGGTDPGDGGTDPDDGKNETPNKSPDQSDGGGSWGIVSLLGLLFLAIRRRR